MSDELIQQTDTLRQELLDNGYKVQDPPEVDKKNKGTTMNLRRKAAKRAAWKRAVEIDAWLKANQDYALRLCRMK
jgi:hypothetical protein